MAVSQRGLSLLVACNMICRLWPIKSEHSLRRRSHRIMVLKLTALYQHNQYGLNQGGLNIRFVYLTTAPICIICCLSLTSLLLNNDSGPIRLPCLSCRDSKESMLPQETGPLQSYQHWMAEDPQQSRPHLWTWWEFSAHLRLLQLHLRVLCHLA